MVSLSLLSDISLLFLLWLMFPLSQFVCSCVGACVYLCAGFCVLVGLKLALSGFCTPAEHHIPVPHSMHIVLLCNLFGISPSLLIAHTRGEIPP